MKTANIKYTANAMLNGKCVATRMFCTEQAKDNWCNKQYRRFGEDVMVIVRNLKTDAVVECWQA